MGISILQIEERWMKRLFLCLGPGGSCWVLSFGDARINLISPAGLHPGRLRGGPERPLVDEMSSLFPPHAHSWRLLTKWLTWTSLGAKLPPVPTQRRAVRSLPGVSAWWGGSSACLPHPRWSGSTPAALSSDQPQLIRAQLCENSLSFCARKAAPRGSVCCVPCGCAPCGGGWAFFSLSLSLSQIVWFGFSWHSQSIYPLILRAAKRATQEEGWATPRWMGKGAEVGLGPSSQVV